MRTYSPQATAPSAQPGNTTFNDSQIEMTRQQILQNPAMRAQITASNPMMGRVLENPEQFKRMFMEMQRMSAGGGPAGARSVSVRILMSCIYIP